MRQLAFLAIAALISASPASAAPTDLSTLPLAQRATLMPPETAVVFRGKTTTLGVLRKAHASIMAHFANLSSPKVHLEPFEPVISLLRVHGSEHAGLVPSGTTATLSVPPPPPPQAQSTPTPKPTPTPPTSAITMFPNAAPAPQPIDYQAACGVFTLCVYLPPVQPEEITMFANGNFVVIDPLMSPQVCTQDGGLVFLGGMCIFYYMTTAKISVYAGNPPALRWLNLCSNDAFTTIIDPKGAAEISGDPSALAQSVGTNAIVCAIDLGVPS